MDSKFVGLIERTRAAVTVKDADGYCVYANRVAEVLRAAAPGELEGKHITEMAGSDARLVEREFNRFKAEGFWVGQYPVRHSSGELVEIRGYHFTHRDRDDVPLYVSFTYSTAMHSGFERQGPARLGQHGLNAQDVCVLQLLVEGYSDEQAAFLLGVGTDTLKGFLAPMLDCMGVTSRTAACVSALKSKLVV